MIYDLTQVGGSIERTADVAVIGGGIAGLVLASRLCPDCRVLVLESGDRQAEPNPSDLDVVESVGDPYLAPTAGRARGLGGTSSKWGGALLPFQAHDFDARPGLNLPAWPVDYEDIEAYFPQVEQLFGLAPGPYDRSVGGWLANPEEAYPTFVARYAKWPRFSRRNVAALLRRTLEQSSGPEVWLRATCARFEFSSSSHGLKALTACAPDGSTLRVTAQHYVLAAGAIESTRLLQWMLAEPNAPRPAATRPTGAYLHDHVSAELAEIQTDDPNGLNELAGFRFEDGGMRSFRLELSHEAQRRHSTAGGFVHIAFTPSRPSGFGALRDTMRGLQAGRLDVRSAFLAAADAPYLAETAYWRFAKRQLRWPRPARYELHVVAEQLPNSANRISLASDTDRYGVPRARVEWRVHEAEVSTLRTIAACLDSFWRQGALSRLGQLKWVRAPERITAGDLGGVADVFHPGGTTRMGADETDSVVDRNLVVWDIPNLSIASTSTFPTGAASNPTMTLIAFALRLADHLKLILKNPSVAIAEAVEAGVAS